MFINKLASILGEKGFSNIQQLVKETTLSRNTVVNMNNNPFFNSTLSTVNELCKVLNVSFDELIEWYPFDLKFNEPILFSSENNKSVICSISCEGNLIQDDENSKIGDIYFWGEISTFEFKGNQLIRVDLTIPENDSKKELNNPIIDDCDLSNNWDFYSLLEEVTSARAFEIILNKISDLLYEKMKEMYGNNSDISINFSDIARISIYNHLK